MVAIHQVVPVLSGRDAIGNHARGLQRLIRRRGIASELYVGEAAPELRGSVHHYRELPDPHPGTHVLYQMSIGCKVGDWLTHRRDQLLLDYHNVTPAELYAGWEPAVAAELNLGRHQLQALAPRSELAMAVSPYNERELREAGARRTAVVPILMDDTLRSVEPDPRVLDELASARGARLLFVGRLSPNKCQHDLVSALALYRRLYDPDARLYLVGGVASDAYVRTLRSYARALGLKDAVVFVGSVTPAQLRAHYRGADAFVCLSEHEGFCVPLVEAMQHELPIVAFDAAAVGETVAGAGIVLPRKDVPTVAAAVHRAVTDGPLRAALGAAGLRRAADFEPAVVERELDAVLDDLLERG